MIQLFGAPSVYGRVLAVREMRSMVLADRVVRAIQARKASGNWADWAEKNPTENELIIDAMKAAHNVGES